MSRTRNCFVFTVGTAAGLFLTALTGSASAAADTTVATNPAPGLPGLVEQVVTSPASIPQQILQTTTSALTGAPATPATPPPLAQATLNLPNTAPTAGGVPTAPAGLPGVSGLPGAGDLSRFLPFPMPNLGTTPTAPVGAPAAMVPSLVAPSVPVTVPSAITPALTFPVSGLP